MRSSRDVLTDVRRQVTGWASGPGPNICLNGADAFAHPELPDLVAGVVELGVERLMLTTAGPALAHGTNAAGSIDAGVRQLEIYVLSVEQQADPGLHVQPFDGVRDGIRAYLDAASERQAPVAVSARVRACPHTHSLVPATVATLAAMGVVAVTVEVAGELVGARADRRAAARSGSSVLLDRAWVAAVVDSGVVNRAWVTIEGASGDSTVPAGLAEGHLLPGARAWTRCEALR